MSDKIPCRIVDGGNKFELFAQLADIGRYSDRRSFPLYVRNPFEPGQTNSHEIRVHINGITAESGNGESWIIQGYIATVDLKRFPWLNQFSHFFGLYDTRRRTGSIELGSIELAGDFQPIG